MEIMAEDVRHVQVVDTSGTLDIPLGGYFSHVLISKASSFYIIANFIVKIRKLYMGGALIAPPALK